MSDAPDSAYLLWVRFEGNAGGKTWHAWRRGEDRSVCRCLRGDREVGPERGRFTGRTDQQPTTDRTCRSCLLRLGLPVPLLGPPPSPNAEQCTGRMDCACTIHRRARKAGAAKFLEQVEQQVHGVTCGCARRWVREAPEASEYRERLEEAEQHFYHALFLWEVTGFADCKRKAGWHGAYGELVKVWDVIGVGFGSTGREHLCGLPT